MLVIGGFTFTTGFLNAFSLSLYILCTREYIFWIIESGLLKSKFKTDFVSLRWSLLSIGRIWSRVVRIALIFPHGHSHRKCVTVSFLSMSQFGHL